MYHLPCQRFIHSPTHGVEDRWNRFRHDIRAKEPPVVIGFNESHHRGSYFTLPCGVVVIALCEAVTVPGYASYDNRQTPPFRFQVTVHLA